MCILCGIQKWSRQVASMLPWLAVPLVALSVLSQFFLPPALRFEPTSPRLACVLVLLGTLFWYEILVPHLSLWRARYSARHRQRQLSEILEQERRRRSSTRCCRNCSNPYRDQNPPGGGGRFVCSYCGHVSKRPKLDLRDGSGRASRGQSWLINCVKCLAGQLTLENLVVSAFRLLSCIFSYTRWAWKKVLNLGSLSEDDGCFGRDSRGFPSRRGENGENSLESKEEKARRKAEEKRQARLEREMLEEEERKQREEVARLVEERRKLRDEMLEAEKESIKRSQSAGKRDCRKGAEKRRQEGRKENDKGSSKSNSDGEEVLEKRTNREREGKLARDKKSENERRVSLKHPAESQRSHSGDRMKGYFRSPFRGSVTKASKPANGCVDQRPGSGNRKDARSPGYVIGKATSNGDGRKSGTITHRPMEADVQPRPPVQKKSWLQLFTRSSSAVSPCPYASTTNFSHKSSQFEVHNIHINDQRTLPNYLLDNHVGLGHSLPFPVYPSINCSFARNSFSSSVTEGISPRIKGSRYDLISDDLDIFEDPCFVPDPVALLGPVSESLDNFPLDLGTVFISDHKTDDPHCIKNAHVSSDVSRPSPIESPLSRQRVLEKKHSVTGQLSLDLLGSNLDESSNTHEQGTWQMWGTPLAQDGLGLIAGANWLSQLGNGQIKSYKEDAMRSLLQDPIASHVRKENLPGRYTPQSLCMGNYQNGGICSPVGLLPNDNDLLVQKTLFNSLPVEGDNGSFPLNQMDNLACSEVTYDAPSRPSAISKPSQANCWSKRGCTPQGPQDVLNSLFVRPLIGGPFLANPDI